MKIAIAILAVGCLVLGTVTPIFGASTEKGKDKYTCVFDESNPFSDGTTGIAEVSIKVTGNGSTVVNVEYYTDDYAEYLGKYQERDGDVVPSNKDEACQFAFEHYEDRE